MMSKGEISTEMLIIAGLVLIVALVAVDFLYVEFMNAPALPGSKTYWAAATPLAMKSYSVTGSAIKLDISNADASMLSITDISVDGNSVFSSNTTTINSGADSTIIGNLAKPCNNTFSYNLVITFNKQGNVIKEIGAVPLAGTCS